MAKKNVIAYFMHEYEMSSALKVLVNPEVTESFVIGELEETEIEALKKQGLIVEEVQSARPEMSDDQFSVDPASLNNYVLLHTKSLFNEAVPAPVDYYSVQLYGPLLEPRRQQLKAFGGYLGDRLADGGYKMRLHANEVISVNSLHFVKKITWINPETSSPDVILTSIDISNSELESKPEVVTFDLRLNDPKDKVKVLAWLKLKKILIVGDTARKIRFQLKANSPEVDELAMLPEIDRIDEYIHPKLTNDHARYLLGIDHMIMAPGSFVAEDGTDQIVAVADTGIDEKHPDFNGRIIGTIDRGGTGVTSDPHGHGTHVAGSILGDGTASSGKIKGVAPKAKLFFQSLADAYGRLVGLPVDLNDLFDEAYNAGARIHNNSWSAVTNSVYTMSSEEVDEYINNHKDMLIVFAAGNEGSGYKPRKANPGYVDWLSIGSPASCKNALTVGASRSSRNNGPRAHSTWNAVWPNRFPDPPISMENVSGDPECIAAFSSRGPCDDHRIKPDIVAPGTDILSTRSSRAPSGTYTSKEYTFDSGTSMATPLVSGCAALVRQYYVQSRGHPMPSAALLKATLVNSTKWLTGNDANAEAFGRPNYHQGHGRVCINLAIPNSSQPGMNLQFVDDWQNFQFTRTGQRMRYQFVLPANAPELRLCMAYSDYPARGLQNNLNLIAEHIESGTKYLGNANLPNALTLLDSDNNLEVIRIDGAQQGTYLIQVLAANLLHPNQDFALVVTGVGVPTLTSI
ncbi:MAG TPA: S8 family serine peptidase [Methylotenera sp.]|nr:S8 family serine peptidase [Methylotenera sp.]